MADWVRLGDVCTISGINEQLNFSEEYWLLNLDMVEKQTGRILSYQYVSAEALEGSIIGFDTNNVLYSKLRPNLNKVVLPDCCGYATSEMVPLKPDAKVLSREYLAEYLRSDVFVKWAISKTTGAKMPRLGKKELLNKKIPLPSLSEQKKISALLKKISDLIGWRQQQLVNLDELVKSRFIEMFGDPVCNPKGWEKVSLSDIAELKIGPFGSLLHKEDYDELVKSRFIEMFGDPVCNPKGWEKVSLSDIAELKIGPFGSLLHKEDYCDYQNPDLSRCLGIRCVIQKVGKRFHYQILQN